MGRKGGGGQRVGEGMRVVGGYDAYNFYRKAFMNERKGQGGREKATEHLTS